MAKMGNVNLPVTLDMGADITLLPAKLARVENKKTEKTALVKGVWDETRAAPLAQVHLVVGEVEVRGTTAMVPGDQLGWEETLAFSLDDPKQVDLLQTLNNNRKERYGNDSRYIPMKVSKEGSMRVQ